MHKEKQETAHPNTLVKVSAPARLHLGFLDLNGERGRKFGSIGLAIDTHHTTIEVSHSETTHISSPSESHRISTLLNRFYDNLGQHILEKDRAVTINVMELIPEHAGFGSGTQLALTLGTALCKLHGIAVSTREIAFKMGRGTRSGIGIATFDSGGFIIDGGLGKGSTVPPVLIHQSFPSAWRIVLINDASHDGMHGEDELTAFKTLPVFPQINAQSICHLTLMKLVPALIENNISSFGEAITEIQTLIGDHFAPAQGGRYTSDAVAKNLQQAQRLAHKGISQTSWGPTGCVFVDSEANAKQLVHTLTEFSQNENLNTISFSIAAANSVGANIEITNV